MLVGELIIKLKKYNPYATVNVVVNGHPKEFEICYGSSEGCTPETCDCVDIMIDCEEENV